MQRTEWHIIVNESAGSGKGKRVLNKTRHYLINQHIPFKVYSTTHAGHEKEITQQLISTTLIEWSANLELFPLLVIIGGDGTLHEVINTLADYPNIPIAYLPGGSGNDFARGANISRRTLKALKHIEATTQPKSLHLVKAYNQQTKQNYYGVNNLGIGLDAAIVKQANSSQAKGNLNRMHLGALAYLFASIKVLREQQPFPVDVTFDQKKQSFKRAYLCTVTNHPYFGGGVAIDPTANVLEPKLSLVVVERISFIKILGLICRLLLKTHLSSRHVNHFKASTFEISTNESVYGQIDGEELDKEDFHLTFSIAQRLFWQ
ncbi:hypothetical protein CBF34_06435 [Vagococcus penaei]|uniref:Uncharacterized protein n=1 Tax=Vagococcus penaei TaxID=633807 RepID=A0A1Q2D765_9ENTE|nr:diacylglycerol kinase family protein [Vagococcus penaei]AQP54170.1 hypothetical protein BW732_08015 [Vagococcus penaei]RSU02169.1 hypothetical protein CBF34_06435 [Vagococcus penaei]